MSDQGYTRIEDGCPSCKEQFVIVPRGKGWYFQCPGCQGYYGPAEPADQNCVTTPDGGCEGKGCMHDAEPEV